MNKDSLIIIGLMPVLCTGLLFTGVIGCSRPPSSNGQAKEVLKAEKKIWTCSMDPQVRQDHPGNCPICGMTLGLLSPMKLTESTSASNLPPSFSSAIGMKRQKSMETMIHLVADQRSSGNIRVSPVEEKMLRRQVELFGEFSYVTDQQIDFTWYYGGRIEKTLINYNTTEIKEGAPLLEVYSDEAVADQRDCLEMLMDLRKHAVAEQKVFESEYGTNTERISLMGMSYEHKNINARLNTMKDRLTRIGMTAGDFQALESTGKIRGTFTINAPCLGTLLGSLPHVGEHFSVETVLFRLVPLKEVWFVADVYEQDLPLLKLGEEIAIRSKTFPEKIFKGKLVFIGREVDPQKRTVTARFLVPNRDSSLLPQLTATGALEVGGQKAQLVVPASAVIDTGRRQVVYVETAPSTYAMRTVKAGTVGNLEGDNTTRWVPVLEGLAAGEKVVSAGAFLIDAEAQLQELPAPSSH